MQRKTWNRRKYWLTLTMQWMVVSTCYVSIGKSFPDISCLSLHGLYEESTGLCGITLYDTLSLLWLCGQDNASYSCKSMVMRQSVLLKRTMPSKMDIIICGKSNMKYNGCVFLSVSAKGTSEMTQTAQFILRGLMLPAYPSIALNNMATSRPNRIPAYPAGNGKRLSGYQKV